MVKRRRRFKQTATLAERLTQEVSRLRDQAKMLSPGPEQAQLWRKVHQAEAALRMDEWLASPSAMAPATVMSLDKKGQAPRSSSKLARESR